MRVVGTLRHLVVAGTAVAIGSCQGDDPQVASRSEGPSGMIPRSDTGSESPQGSPTSAEVKDGLSGEATGSGGTASSSLSPAPTSADSSQGGATGASTVSNDAGSGGVSWQSPDAGTENAPMARPDASVTPARATTADASVDVVASVDGGRAPQAVDVQARGSLTAPQQATLIAGVRVEYCAGIPRQALEPLLTYLAMDADWVQCVNSAPDCDALLDCPEADPPVGSCLEEDQFRQEAYCEGSVVIDCGASAYRYDCADLGLECDGSIPSSCIKDPPDCDQLNRSCEGNVVTECNGDGLLLEMDCSDVFGTTCVESSAGTPGCLAP